MLIDVMFMNRYVLQQPVHTDNIITMLQFFAIMYILYCCNIMLGRPPVVSFEFFLKGVKILKNPIFSTVDPFFFIRVRPTVSTYFMHVHVCGS